MAIRHEKTILLGAGFLASVGSGINPYDRLTWLLEIAPILLGVPALILTYRSFPLTPLAYRLIFLHALILMLGGHYTYARVPFGFWVQDLLDFSRNHYDRVGHLAQGFVPAIITREILLRNSPLTRGGWLFFLVTAVCLALSAFYEFIEWWAAVIGGKAAEAFLGTQGDVWDTQWDMFLAMIGALPLKFFCPIFMVYKASGSIVGRVQTNVANLTEMWRPCCPCGLQAAAAAELFLTFSPAEAVHRG